MPILKKLILLFCIFWSFQICAQPCPGSLGNSVYTISFGAGNNPGLPNNNVPLTYQYTDQDCPQEGFYSLRNTSFFCFNSQWHNVPFDHSPNDPTGYFLIVNALNGPSLIYEETVSGLCPNTPFEFNAWVANLAKQDACNSNAVNPNLTFTITDNSGNVLTQYNTGSISENQLLTWLPHSFYFTPPPNGTVKLKITSLASAGCGNEFAIDDITFRPCGPNISAAFSNSNTQEINFCEGTQQNILLTSTFSNAFPNPVLQWQANEQGFGWVDIPGATSANYTLIPPSSIGEYRYRCAITDMSFSGNSSCRFVSNTLKVTISEAPFVQATAYQYGCYGGTVYLGAAGGEYFEWTGPNGFYSTDQIPRIDNLNFSHAGVYVVKVTSVCSAYASVNLIIYAAPVATLNLADISICEGDSVQLVAGGSIHYDWTPKTGVSNDTIFNPFVKPRNDIRYTVRVYNEYSCYDTAGVNVTVWKKPKAFAGPDKFVKKGKSVKLEGGITGSNINYSWSPPEYLDNPLVVQPNAGPPVSSIYTLTVVSNDGCGTSTDNVKVEVIDKLFIPTGFTPNNDGLNDKWEITIFEDYPKAVVEVFNRFGQLVYRSLANNYKPWDGNFKGQPAIPGVYAYVVRLNNNTAVLKGTLMLIR